MNFTALVQQIQQTDSQLKTQAGKAINRALTIRNWLIGHYIVEYEQRGKDRAEYGKKLLQKLASSLKRKGLSFTNLKNFRLFYLTYKQIGQTLSDQFKPMLKSSIVQEYSLGDSMISPETLISKLSYSHFTELIKITDDLKRAFYEVHCIQGTWNVRELRRQIHTLFYERSGMSGKPEELKKIVQEKSTSLPAESWIKDMYVFEFLGLPIEEALEEQGLEQALIDHIQNFLLEFGHGFCFEARQKRILIGDEYFHIDLTFYHRILKCHVLIELKVDEFKHEHTGQLNAYLNYFKDQVMAKDDNPPIGILLVTHKNEALVHYATTDLDPQVFVKKYLVELPDKEEIKALIESEVRKIREG